jgi:hypothetical protein
MRSLQRPNARAFLEYVGQQLERTRILWPSGEPMVTLLMDEQRVNASGMHIIRGLYFHQTRKRLSGSSADVQVASRIDPVPDDLDMLNIARVFDAFTDQRSGAAGTAFSYVAALGDRWSVWLMLLYDYFVWIGVIDERNPSEREANRAPLIISKPDS